MRSHHKQNRRPRGGKPQDDDQYGTSRMDEGSDSYSRSHRASHRSDDRRTSSASGRDYYDGYRDMGSHSRGRHDEDGWFPDVNRYREEEVYRRDDDYDPGMRRDTDWSARSAGDSQYSSVRDDWSHQHYDHTSSYHESSSWSVAAPRDAYDSRNSYYDDWPAPSARGSSSHSRDDDRHLRHGEKHDREDLGWSRDHRRDKSVQQPRYQSDSGWDVRRRDSGWEDKVAEDPQVLEDRAWEPAPSWKSSHRNEGTMQHRGQNQNHAQRNTQQKHQQYSKGGKRTHNPKQQRRDWRNDDSGLNNWTRRDYHSQNRKTGKVQQPQQQPQQQRHKQYRSHSRSRSPAESYHSHLSSRGRSRSASRSPAPKRRRRESSPPLQRSRTPSDRDAAGWVPRPERSIHSRSPSPQHDPKHQRSRRTSVSSVSSETSDHTSRSNSPNTRPRAVHRLPTSESSAPVGHDHAHQNTQHGNPRQPPPHSNGKYHSHDRHDNAPNPDWLPNSSTADPRYNGSMPPPPTIPAPRSNYPLSENVAPEPTPPSRVNIASRPNRKQSFGFKPISRAQPTSSSSLRKFFPGDDDDAEQSQNTEPPSPIQQRPGYRSAPVAKGVWPPPEQQEEHQPHQPHHPPSWPLREPMEYPRAEPSYNGQLPVKQTPPPQSTFETAWNGDGTTWDGDRLAHQAFVPVGHVNNDKPQRPPLQRSTESIVQPSPRPSPVPRPRPPSPPVTVPPPRASVQHPPSPTLNEPPTSQKVSTSSGKPIYNILTQVGEGTFGKVYKARNSISNLLVALKRIRMETEKDGFPVTAMREIKLLQSLRHENIVQLYEMIVSNGSVYMVFEYMDHDLTGILSQTQFEFTPAHLKSLCHQMLAGLAYLHYKGVIHRDIKGSNILINNRGELKLADFGLARFYQKRRRTDYTNRVITLWYRPPELLFGATIYGPEVDMWSAGCIMLELFTKKPVFQGNDEIHQLDVIHKILGTPSPSRWPGLVDLPWYELAKPRDEIPNRFRDIFQKWMSPAALDLAEQLLAYDPLRRISAVQAMEAPYFTQESPSAALPTGLATLEGEWHELETKRERAKKRKKNESGA